MKTLFPVEKASGSRRRGEVHAPVVGAEVGVELPGRKVRPAEREVAVCWLEAESWDIPIQPGGRHES